MHAIYDENVDLEPRYLAAVAQLVMDIIQDTSSKFVKKSFGVGEPGTNWDKPFFY